MTISSDGAGIYILGRQENSEMIGNYVSNTSHYSTGLYYDQGTTGMTGRDNVTMNTGITWLCNTLLGNNSLKNTYSGDIGKYYNATYNELIDLEDAKLFSYSNPPEEVTRIMAEAGITDEWLFIKERIPEADSQRIHLVGPDSAENQKIKSVDGMGAISPRVNEDVDTANKILETGTFGSLLWNFAPEVKGELAYWIAAVKNDKLRTDDVYGGHVEEMMNLEEAILAAYDSVYHPSYEEMVTMCKEAEAKMDDYAKSALDAFKKEVTAICATNPAGRGDKAVAASRLEKAYEKLMNQRNKAEIVSVYVEGATTSIDAENKTATVELPVGMKAEEAVPVIVSSAGSRVDADVRNLKLSNGVAQIPLYIESLKRHDIWTLIFKQAQTFSENGVVSVEPRDWTGGNVNVEKSNVGGALVIEPWFQPTMYEMPMKGKISFSLWAPEADVKNGLGIIFSAQNKTPEVTTKEGENTFYMALLSDQTLTLYRVEGGVWSAYLTVEDVGFDYGAFNRFEIEVKNEHKLNRIMIKLDGSVLVNTLIDTPVGEEGYFGILTKDMAVKVK